jgi:predicted RND superfamily exporter protein
MFGKWIFKYNAFILIITFLICGWSIFLFPKLKTDVDFKQYFPEGEPALANYESFAEKMGASDKIIVIAITNKTSVFDSIFLKKINQLQLYIDTIPGIKNSSSILTLKKYKNYGLGLLEKRAYLIPERTLNYTEDSTEIFQDFQLTQHFITKNSKILKIILQVSDSIALSQIDTIVHKIDAKTFDLKLKNYHILGRKFIESEYKNIVNKELKTSIVLCFTFVFLILIILHRSIIGAVLPLFCMVMSLIMLYGYMAILNRPLTIMSNLFPTIVLIVGISDVIHISSKFAYESLQTNDTIFAINKTIKEIGLTTFINSFTTALGFLTLLTMSMKTMQSFGIDAAVGLMICWVNSIFLLPALLVRFNLAKFFRKPVVSSQWHDFLNRILIFTYTYQKQILISFVLLIIISVFGILNVNTNNHILPSLPENNRLYADFQFFDKNLGGGRSFELIITTKNNHKLNDKNVLQNIEKLENYLRKESGVSEIISPVLIYKWLNHVFNKNTNWQLSNTQNEYNKFFLYSTANKNNFPIQIIDNTNTIGRLSGRLEDIGRKDMEYKEIQIMKWITQNIDTSIVNFEFTGFDYMTDIGHQLKIDNTINSFLLEIILVSLLIGFIYKSFKMVTISFIANIIPIIIIGGFLGFSNIEFRGSTTIIFVIGYVIAVDDTLHFINRFQIEKRKGLNTEEALRETYLYTGRAMVMTSLVLLGGFLILLYSSFNDIYIHGFLMSLIIIIALITELLITPILITYFNNNNNNKT